ncbi:hypothetical protein DRQ53_15560 [bacterium]|nr:MAG: hypothetical protein DRQ53_15560 [bacterium]
MGLLTAPQIAAIGNAPVYRQVWIIHVPRSSGSSTTDNVTIHDDDGGPDTVLDPNQYDVEGYNQSLAVPGNLTSGMYRFTVRNSDGKFNASVGSAGQYFYNTTGTYAAMPSECKLSHYSYVRVAGSWSELTMSAHESVIQSVEYDDNKKTAVIEVKAASALALEYVFTEDDGTEEDTGMNVTWP